ncbi:MAG TPA: hypothetical protein VGC54_11455 [Planctomycetota bacterium]
MSFIHRPTLLMAAAGVLAAGAFAQNADGTDQGPFAAHRVIETQANTFAYQRQENASLDIAPDGRVLVAWDSRRQEAGTFGVFAQLLDPLGRPLGTEIHVNHFMPGAQSEPAVGFATDGSAWVAWTSVAGQDGQYGGIFLRRLGTVSEHDGDGNAIERFGPVCEEIPVNETVEGDQANPALAVGTDGRILVTWVSDHLGRHAAFARLFDADGKALGGEFRLGTGEEGNESLASVVALGEGRFATVWTRFSAPNHGNVVGRVFDREGRPVAREFALSESNEQSHIEASLDSDRGDQFAAAWMTLEDDGYRVSARRFDAAGKALGATVQVPACDTGYQNGGTVTMAPDGRFVVAWNHHQEKVTEDPMKEPTRFVSVMGQLFAADGSPTGQPWRINQFDHGQQDMQVGLNSRHAVWSALGQVAFAWSGNSGKDGRAVSVTMFAPQDLNPAAPPAVEPLAALNGITWRDVRDMAPPDWDPNWVDDSYLPASPPAGPDFGFEAFASTGWTPPDPDLAVGPNHLVVVVNVAMKFYDKAGNQTFSTNLEPFFNTSGFVFDPVALYDEQAGRFVIAAAEHASNGDDYFDIAVSDDDNPNGAWHKYRVNVNSICGFLDFDNLGMTGDAYIVAADCFSNPTGNKIHVLEKAPMLVGGAMNRTSFTTSTSQISMGATRNYDGGSTAYLVSSYSPGSPNLGIRAIKNAGSSPSLVSYNLNVGSFSNPPDAQQSGTSNQADTIDHRIKNGVVRNGFLYVTHNVNGGDGAAKVEWYKIDLRGWPNSGLNPILADNGRVNEGTNVDSWFGDVNVDAAGNMTISYNRSSPSQFIGIYHTQRKAGDPAGQTDPGVQMQISTSPETGSRWGDYSGVEEDPASPGTFWSHLEYRTGSWRTWAGRWDVAAGFSLETTSLVRGQAATLTAKNALDGETVYFLYSTTGQGAGSCFGQLGGLCLDILDPVKIAGTATSNGGVAALIANVPNNAPQVPIYMQAVVRRGVGNVDSIKSNVAVETVQ